VVQRRNLRTFLNHEHRALHCRHRDNRNTKDITSNYGYLRLRREDYQRIDVETLAKFVREQRSRLAARLRLFQTRRSGIGPKTCPADDATAPPDLNYLVELYFVWRFDFSKGHIEKSFAARSNYDC